MQENNDKDITKYLSLERLSTYYFNGKYNDSEALRRYRYNLNLSSAIFEAISVFEVVLRNSIVMSWQSHFKDTNWPSSKLNIPTTKKYEHTLGDVEKAIRKVSRRKKAGHNNGDVISELTFGFWLYCFDAKFDYINKFIIKNIFTHDKERTPNLIADVRRIKAELIPIWKLRNRVSHHEPIFHLKELRQIFENIRKYISYIEPACLELHDESKFINIYSSGW